MRTTRRHWLTTAVSGSLALARQNTGFFRYSICSETFAGLSFRESCRAASRIGYTGIEVMPANLGDDPGRLPPSARGAFRNEILDANLTFVGTHNLMAVPKGLHLTSSDAGLRRKSWDYFSRLIDLTADLGSPAVMVFGSGRQRAAANGVSPPEAVRMLTEGLAALVPVAVARGTTILLEPLAPHLCNVVNQLDEAVQVVREIASPAIQTMFDTHNTAGETKPGPELIAAYIAHIKHVHLNEMDGRYPGSGHYPFTPVMRALRKAGYEGWMSVEVFELQPDGETVAHRSYRYLGELERKLGRE